MAKLTYSIGRQEALSPRVAERSARFDGFDPFVPLPIYTNY
jgi:hypothetical protein